MTTGVAILEKNAREEVRVALSEYRGKRLIDVRTFMEDYHDGTKMAPIKKGVCLKIEQLDGLIDALGKAINARSNKDGWSDELDGQSGVSPGGTAGR